MKHSDDPFIELIYRELDTEWPVFLELLPHLLMREYLKSGEFSDPNIAMPIGKGFVDQKICFLWMILIEEGYEK